MHSKESFSMDRAPRFACALCGAVPFVPKLTVDRAGERFSIVACASCGHVFVADPPADTANHVDINKIDWAFRPRHRQIRRLILSRLKPGQRVLEIGCGRGEVGHLLRNDPLKYVGYEPAAGLSDFGIRAGVPIVQQVYEGGGMVIVITPNVHDIRAVSPVWRARHLWVPPDHINFFSKKDIESLFRFAHLRPKRFRFSPLQLSDYRFFPRAAAETIGLSIFGHNVYATG
jgi:hypothetical protein